MKTKLLISVLVVLVLVTFTSVTLWAQQGPSRQQAPEEAETAAPGRRKAGFPQPSPEYKPPQLGAPGGRVGGGTRGIGAMRSAW